MYSSASSGPDLPKDRKLSAFLYSVNDKKSARRRQDFIHQVGRLTAKHFGQTASDD